MSSISYCKNTHSPGVRFLPMALVESTPPRNAAKAFGFTLIELSIVLVIIGLLVGGVLVGQDLIRAASVKATLAQIEKYNTAANTFKGKYDNYLPGDIPAAPAAKFGFAARGSYTGEGDGNGIIEGVYGNAPGEDGGIFQSAGETVMFWADLSAAHLIDGGFSAASSTNTPASNLSGAAIANYLPQAKIGRGNYIYVWSQSSGGVPGNGVNYFGLSATSLINSDGITTSSPGLSVAEAYSIDKKIDDGSPMTGQVTAQYVTALFWYYAGGGYSSIATPGSSTTCYDNNNVSNTPFQYSLGQNNGNGVNCALSFQFQSGD